MRVYLTGSAPDRTRSKTSQTTADRAVDGRDIPRSGLRVPWQMHSLLGQTAADGGYFDHANLRDCVRLARALGPGCSAIAGKGRERSTISWRASPGRHWTKITKP